ncbi:ABC-three component system middle component 8 [Marinobacter azerbaijanicus]|uniref:ABC-three component system middle component 8 n=1 Tax=Marinobacter azerbaijanicus TaxID=3050455 RepID=UPI0030EE9A83
MLRPTKYSHPDSTVISAALLLLKALKDDRIIEYSELLKLTKSRIAGGENLYIPALSFLFIMGKVRYHQNTDSFEYIDHHETN